MSFANPHAASSAGVAPKRSAGEQGHEGKGLWEVWLLLWWAEDIQLFVKGFIHLLLYNGFIYCFSVKLRVLEVLKKQQ